MKILVTGGKGQLGSELHKILLSGKSELGDIPQKLQNAEVRCVDIDELDISNFDQVSDIVNSCMPEVIINCAAYTNVDKCETDSEQAFKVNSIGPRNLAIIAEKTNAKLIHISTDYVFEGNGIAPYYEWDLCNPQNTYGHTKYLGEQYVREFCTKYFIVRTSWLYGYHGNNFVKTIIKLAREKEELKVVNDQRGNPTNTVDLVHHLLKIADSTEYGLYHCTGNGECSWYDFACEIVQMADIKCSVLPCTTDDFVRKAKRPSYSSLENMMLKCTIGDEMRHWKLALKEFISKYLRRDNL